MPFGSISFVRSFRFRVMVGLFVVVVGTMILTTMLVGAVLNKAIFDEFDRQLKVEAESTIFDIRTLCGDDVPQDWTSSESLPAVRAMLDRRARSLGREKWLIRFYDADRTPLYESEDLFGIPRPNPADTGKTHETGPYRWMQVIYPDNGQPPRFWLQIGRSDEALIDDFNLLNRTLFIRGLFVVLLAPLGGYWLARQVTGPLAAIVTTANRLQPEHLSERLPVRGINDELDQVSETINRMLDRIGDYIDRNQAFMANAAHELRSPLAAIRSAAEVALNRSRTPDEYANILTEMIDEVGRLSSMVNRLLLLAEADAGRMAPQPGRRARLDKVVLEAVDMFQAVAESMGVAICTEEIAEAEVPGDEPNLRHLVRNLLDNAIKFSPAGGTIRVSLKIDRENRLASFRVVDQGAGIPDEDMPRLFERFFRGDRSRQRDDGNGGSGLGLSICQMVAKALGGKIEVSSVVGKGTTFVVWLPLAPA